MARELADEDIRIPMARQMPYMYDAVRGECTACHSTLLHHCKSQFLFFSCLCVCVAIHALENAALLAVCVCEVLL